MNRRLVVRSNRSVRGRRCRLGSAIVGLTLVLALATPQPGVAAPWSDDDPEPQGQAGTAGGFAFGKPGGFFLVKGGLNMPSANSDIYAFNEELLTLDSRSYWSALFGVDVGVVVADHVDLVFGFAYTSATPISEFRDYVDEFDSPIVQQTRLRQSPLTGSVRINLVERGRAVGSYAWIPKKVVPYVGGGGGIMWWSYEQFGDFVDFADFTIFTDHFKTEGWDPTLHAFGGVDVSFTARFALNIEVRYAWASGELAPAFVGFEPIDLSGLQINFGASFRF